MARMAASSFPIPHFFAFGHRISIAAPPTRAEAYIASTVPRGTAVEHQVWEACCAVAENRDIEYSNSPRVPPQSAQGPANPGEQVRWSGGKKARSPWARIHLRHAHYPPRGTQGLG